MHCMSAGYSKFVEDSRGKVPLEGLQSNQMLRVRPTAEGRLEPVTGFESWSFSIQPGRGICDHEKTTRDEKIARWVNNIPPEPDWDRLNINYLIQDDLPAEPESMEPIFELALSSLELTDHQKLMLEPPESRLKNLVFPKSIRDRATVKRSCKRRNKWATKFEGLFHGKSAKKWAKRLRAGGREELKAEARGTAKARARPASKAEAKKQGGSMAGKLIAQAKKKQKDRIKDRRKYAKSTGKEPTEPCEKSPWHDQEVRVVKENCYEGLRGVVKGVSKYKTEPTEPEKYSLNVLSVEEGGKAGKMMVLDSDEVVIEDPKWAEPQRVELDFRRLPPPRYYCLSGRITYWL